MTWPRRRKHPRTITKYYRDGEKRQLRRATLLSYMWQKLYLCLTLLFLFISQPFKLLVDYFSFTTASHQLLKKFNGLTPLPANRISSTPFRIAPLYKKRRYTVTIYFAIFLRTLSICGPKNGTENLRLIPELIRQNLGVERLITHCVRGVGGVSDKIPRSGPNISRRGNFRPQFVELLENLL